MSLLTIEFDPVEVPATWAKKLESARDQWVLRREIDREGPIATEPRLPDQLSFFAFPEQLLLAYEAHRGESELGHVFRIANGCHDHYDALVVLGSGSDWSGMNALVHACLDPFHNELSRAARGSKPRLYFASDHADNDFLQSLAGRMSRGGYGDTPAEDRCAVIAIESARSTRILRWLVDHVIHRHSRVVASDVPAAVTGVGVRDGQTAQAVRELGFVDALRVPSNLRPGLGLLGPAGLLPAAFMGLDCIQLLVGAAAMNDHLRCAPFQDNLVLRWVASHRMKTSHSEVTIGRPTRRVTRSWSHSLVCLANWIDDVAATNLDPANDNAPLIVRDELVVDTDRTDDLGDVTNPFREQQQSAFASRLDFGYRRNIVHLPMIDTHSLGQFIQLLLLSTELEREIDRQV